MTDFWRSCGYHLLAREDGRLRVTDDYLRAYYGRPELAPVAGSCAAELFFRWQRIIVEDGAIRLADDEGAWHVGLDAESTTLLNEIYNGGDVDEERMRRIIGLYRLEFREPSNMRADFAGKPVFPGLAATADGHLRMKPQNLLMNLPLARRA